MPVTLARYRALVADRPVKFASEEVDYHPRARSPKHVCGNCWHFYRGAVVDRTVCEIFEGKGELRQVDAGADCDFWTADGVEFPLYHPPQKEHAISRYARSTQE